MNLLRATMLAAASAALFIGEPTLAQDAGKPPGGAATNPTPRPPGPAGDPRTDPDQIPDPHPSGKTSDEGATAGSSATRSTMPPSQDASAPAARSANPGAYRGKKSADPDNAANRRPPSARDKPPQ